MCRSILIGQILIGLITVLAGQNNSVSTPIHFRGLWCITQWNEKTKSYSEQTGQAFFYNNSTFTWNFLSDISSTWLNELLTVERSEYGDGFQVSFVTRQGPSPFLNRTSHFSLHQEPNGDIICHLQTNGLRASSVHKLPLKSSLYYTRNKEGCRLFNDEGSHQELSNTKYEKYLTVFDRSLPYENRQAVVFYGSSSIRFWSTLTTDFPSLPSGAINRGFGGSTLEQCWQQFKRVVIPLEPAALIIYAGENDRASANTAADIELSFLKLISTARRYYPSIPIAYISIIPGLSRNDGLTPREEVNERLRLVIERLENVDYINVFDEMLTPDRIGRAELYGHDQVHMNELGYAVWTRVLTDYFQKKKLAVKIDENEPTRTMMVEILLLCQCLVVLKILYSRIQNRRWKVFGFYHKLLRLCIRLLGRRRMRR